MSMISASPRPISSELALEKVSPRGMKAGLEFEAHLIGSLLESWEKTFAEMPGKASESGADDYQYLGTQALAQSLAAKGGLGIGTMISRYLATHQSHSESEKSG